MILKLFIVAFAFIGLPSITQAEDSVSAPDITAEKKAPETTAAPTPVASNSNMTLYDAKDIEFKTENNREKAYLNGELFAGAVILPDNEGRQITYIYRRGEKNGIAIAKYANDNLEIEITYLNNKKNGETIQFYPNGTPQIKETYRDDLLHGEKVLFYENGKPQQQSFYENGKLNGTSTYFDKEGNVQKIEIYQNDVKNGLERIIQNNTLREENNYVNGKITGISKKYNEKYLEEEITYKEGVQDGVHKIYKENGSWAEIPYIDGHKEGIGRSFYPDKKIAQQVQYRNGFKNGLQKSFYSNGQLQSVERYKDDKLFSIARYFSNNGNIQFVRYYVDGVKLAEVNMMSTPAVSELYNAYKNGKLVHYSNKKNLWYQILWLGLNDNGDTVLPILKREMDMYAAPLGNEAVYRKFNKAKFAEYNRNLFFGMSPLSYTINLSADTALLKNFISSINEKNERGTTALQEAVSLNELEIVKFLLMNGADITALNQQKENILFDAIKEEADYKIIEELLNAGVNFNDKNADGFSPLMLSLLRKDEKLFKLFLNHGADVQGLTPQGQPLVFFAYLNKASKKVMNALLETAIDLNRRDNNGQFILMEAVKRDDVEFADALLQKDVDVNLTDNNGESVLSYVLRNDVSQKMRDLIILAGKKTTSNIAKFEKPLWKILLERRDLEHLKVIWEGADISKFDINGESPLYTALQNHTDKEVLDLTLSQVKKADTKLLWTAVQSRNIDFLQKVLSKEAPVNEKNEDGETALNYMIANNYGIKFINALETAQPDINTIDGQQHDALELAISKNDAEITKNLLEHGANPNRVIHGKTYLMTLGPKQDKITELLLSHQADLQTTAESGETMLMMAAANLNTPLVDALLQQNTNVDIRDKNGNSALLYLAQAVEKYSALEDELLKEKLSHIVNVLTAKGVNINTQNGAGETLLMRIAMLAPNKYALLEPLLVERGLSTKLQNQYGKKATDFLPQN